MKKHGDAFTLYRLPGSYGCLIFNKAYPTGTEVSLPGQREVVRIFKEIRSENSRVAVSAPIIRAYISPPKNWKNSKLDCKGSVYIPAPAKLPDTGVGDGLLPGGGNRLYQILYLTYISPEQLSHAEILYRLEMPSRQYYRYREQAITILSIRLWSAPAGDVDFWLEMLTFLESIQ